MPCLELLHDIIIPANAITNNAILFIKIILVLNTLSFNHGLLPAGFSLGQFLLELAV